MAPSDLSKSLRKLGKWGALALGFGSLFAADASAERPELRSVGPGAAPSQQSAARRDTVLVRLDGRLILVSERGGAFEPLSLKDGPQAEELRRLLSDAGAIEHPVSVPLGAIIVANGGAAGDGTKPKVPDTDNGSEKKQPTKKSKQPAPNNSGTSK